MLKLYGCICILIASSGMAYTCILGLRQRMFQMEQLSDLFTAVEGEITFQRCPLPELFLHLAEHTHEPFDTILMQAGSRMEENSEADIPFLWQEVCGQSAAQLELPGEAYRILLRMGEVFAFSSLESSLQLLAAGKKKLDALIEGQYAEFAGKRKLYCCLCYMAGLFSILILI